MTDTYAVHPPHARWTHVALRVSDIHASIDWYTTHTPMKLLDKREDADGYGAWLGHDDSPDKPFILVLAQFFPESDPFKDAPIAKLAPFAHLGVELTSREELDAAAAVATTGGMPGDAADRDASAHRLHLHDQRSRRQHDRAQLRPGGVRPRPEGDALNPTEPEPAAADEPAAAAASYPASVATGDPAAAAAAYLASSTAGDPAAAAASYLASFATGDPAAVAAHVSETFSNVHTSALGSPSKGKAQYRKRLGDFLQTFAGLTYEAEEILAERRPGGRGLRHEGGGGWHAH